MTGHVRGAAGLVDGEQQLLRDPRTSRGRSGPTPPSSRPSICSRNAARAAASAMTGPPRAGEPSGPTEPPTSASRPLTSRASRASWAARRLSRPTCALEAPGRESHAGWRRTTASRSARRPPRDTRGGRPRPSPDGVVDELLETGSLGHAAAEQERAHPAVDEERAGGEAAPEALARRGRRARASVIGPLSNRVGRRRDRKRKDPSCSEGSRGSSLIVQEDLPGIGTLPTRRR